MRQKVTLNNKLGLHARSASIIVKTAQKFASHIKLISGRKESSLKSILGLLCLELNYKEEVIIEAEGIDEEEALEKIVDLIENRLGIISYQNAEGIESVDRSETIAMIGTGLRKNLKDMNA